MKKVFLKIAQFVSFLVAFLMLFVFLVATSTSFTSYFEELFFASATRIGDNYQRIRDFDKWIEEKRSDRKYGLMLGGSTIFSNIDPHILSAGTGIDFFCAGSNSQTLPNSKYILQHCISSGKKIDFLFLGVDHMLWDMKGRESTADWVINNYQPARKYILQMVLHEGGSRIWLNYIYCLVKRMLPYTKEYFGTADNHSYSGKGFSCYTDERPCTILPAVPRKEMSAEYKEAFRNITEICRKENITLILFVPRFINYQPDITPFRNTDALLIDASTMQLDNKYYYDNYHLYCSGTKPYTQWIADRMAGQLDAMHNR